MRGNGIPGRAFIGWSGAAPTIRRRPVTPPDPLHIRDLLPLPKTRLFYQNKASFTQKNAITDTFVDSQRFAQLHGIRLVQPLLIHSRLGPELQREAAPGCATSEPGAALAGQQQPAGVARVVPAGVFRAASRTRLAVRRGRRLAKTRCACDLDLKAHVHYLSDLLRPSVENEMAQVALLLRQHGEARALVERFGQADR